MFGTYMLRIARSSWWIFPLTSMECLFQSFLLVFIWNLFCQILKWLIHFLLRSICLEYLFPSFYPDACSLDEAEDWIMFSSSILLTCVFLLRNWDHWWWEISVRNVCWFLLFCCCCVCVYFFWYADLGLSIPCVFLAVTNLFSWSFHSSTVCRLGFVGSSGDMLSCLLLILFLHWSLGVRVCEDYNGRCWYLVLSLLSRCFVPWFQLPSLVLGECAGLYVAR